VDGMELEDIGTLLIAVSRYIEDTQSLLQKVIAKLKSKITEIRIEDVETLALPLAAEEVKDKEIWTKFGNLVKVNANRMEFKALANAAWSFAQIKHADQGMWAEIEG